MRTRQDITHYRGQDAQFTYSLVDHAGEPLDMDDVDDIVWTLTNGDDGADVLVEKSLGGGTIQVNAPDSKAAVYVDAMDTDAMGLGTYQAELGYVDTLGKQVPLSSGLFFLRDSATMAVT